MVIVKGRDYHSVKYLHTVVVDQDDGEKITARVCDSLRIKQAGVGHGIHRGDDIELK
jgi:hypothetical protein